MTNKEIAKQLSLMAKLMELHDGNSFKIKTFQNAYNNIRRIPEALSELDAEARAQIPQIGKSVGAKIDELLSSGTIADLDQLIQNTPAGIIDIIQIRGLGPKKVRAIWKELGIESATELLYACNENRLVELKGFGAKSQKDIGGKIEYFMASRDKYLYAQAAPLMDELLQQLNEQDDYFYLIGEAARKCPVITEVKILYHGDEHLGEILSAIKFVVLNEENNIIKGLYDDRLKVTIMDEPENGVGVFLDQTMGEEIIADRYSIIKSVESKNILSGIEEVGLADVPMECWDWPADRLSILSDLIEEKDIQGVVHAHSTYSDGSHTLMQMAQSAQAKGYDYFVMTDHSKAAFYANGLTEEEVIAQSMEIDEINTVNTSFRILKGIECDILSDGSMDYTPDILREFEVVIASIHSNLKMTEEKAMMRLIKAIENPSTHILGHLTSRLLLARAGYPVDHKKIIDACAANRMAIELNANPYRLDMDYRWIDYAQNKGVMISINPDAHSIVGIDDIKYGVIAARKGGLTRVNCLNSRPVQDFLAALKS